MEIKDVQLRDLYKDTKAYADKEITVRGWVRQCRGSNKFAFIALNDGSFFRPVQIVLEADKLDNFKEVSNLSLSSVIRVKGTLVVTPDAKQPFEIHASEVVVEAESDPDYPLQNKRHTMEFLREIAHLRPRSNTFAAVFRVRSMLAYAIHQFFQERDFVYVHTPIITGSDAEGAGEMFQITTLDLDNPPRTEDGKVDYSQDFFGKETNLTVSGQLEAEIFAMAFRNVYTFGPTFRAEDSNTTRHASEFWMIEPEMAFADINDAMDTAEAMVKYILQYVIDHAPEEMEFFNKFIDKGLLDRLNHVINSPFERVTYTEAVKLLQESGQKFDYPVEWGIDLQTEHERYLTEHIFKKPVFVTNYPKDIKAFYMRQNEDGKTVAAFDMLVPGIGEIIGGSQREERYDILQKRIDELGMDMSSYWWYMDLRKYGSAVHSGYGLGFERMVMYATGMGNIRDVLPFPRTPKHAEF
jgi:asparaginyl-tRNA synthetase